MANKGDLEYLKIAAEQEMTINNTDYFLIQVLDYMKKVFETKDVIGLWLTTCVGVQMRYDENTDHMEEYMIPDEFLVISDLRL